MKFKQITRGIAGLIAAAIVLVAAPRSGGAQQASVNPALVVSFEGVVASVDMGISQEFPAFELAQADGSVATILTGPYYLLVESGFDIRVGDRMSVRAYPSLWHEDAYVAIELNNLTTAETLVLRDSTGRPLWTNRGGPGDAGMGQCPGTPAGGGQMNIVTLNGIVVSLTMGVGLHYPSFDLALVDGTKVTIMVGPYRYLIEADFSVSPGDRMQVEAFKSMWPDNTYVAVELTDLTTNDTLVLRDADGQPIWTGRNGGGQGGPGAGGGAGGPAGSGRGDCTGWIPPEGSINITTLEGFVVGVNMACGQEFPSFDLATTTGTVTVVTGPYYLLLRSGFDITLGDRMRVRAFESHWYEDTFVAIDLTNLTTADALVLRDATGHPTWPNSQQFANAGIGYGGGAAWLSLDPASIVTIKGTVESVNLGFGDAYATVTLVKGSGVRMMITAGPYRFMLENEFQMRVGDRLKLTAFPSGWFDNIYVAARIKNQTMGRSLTFRDGTGIHQWPRR